MTPEEEKRNRLLKRILPGMAIMIIYFIFINGMLSEKMTKAEADYTKLVRTGVSSASVQNIIRQQGEMKSQISELEKQQKIYRQKLNRLAGFLSDTTPSNDSSTLLSTILANNSIRVKKEQREPFHEDNLSLALQEVWQWLKPEAEKEKNTVKEINNIFVQHLSLSGSYQNMYLAMAAIANDQLKAIPVSLTMKASEDKNVKAGDLDWELVLWM